jgi:hypothetical protein
VINIEVRQNGTFSLGYPYNASVDSYFEGLTSDFISNYGLDDSTVLEINNYKNTTLQFDRDLHEFIVKLSAFIVGFETTGKVIIAEYEELVSLRKTLEFKQQELSINKSDSVKEYEFVLSNITQLHDDIVKVVELINYYQDKIVDDTYSYSDTYISDTELELTAIEDITATNENDFQHYKSTLFSHVLTLVDIKIELSEYSFYDTSLRSLYEAWNKRPEQYYQNLVEYFKNDYNSVWTYGKSLMYGEKLKTEIASTNLYKKLSGKWQSSLFKRYSFDIEKTLKEYSLFWLENHNTFEKEEFILVVETKRVELLKNIIIDVEQIINSKKFAVNSVIPYEKESNYYLYRELIIMKRKYIIDNMMAGVDQAKIDEFDEQLNFLVDDYNYVVMKFSQHTYWEYLADWEMHTELLTELQRKLDKAEMAISREFKKEATSNAEFVEKIEYYTTQKDELESKVNELTSMKDKLEVNNNVYNDELTLYSSKLYENETLIEQKRNEYVSFFDERIPFFTQNITASENDGIIELLNGNFFRDFDDSYDAFKNYNSNIQWYDVNDREKLVISYESMLDIIKTNLSEEWKKEFSHEILDIKKFGIYEIYFDGELRILYALINKHLLDETYDSTFENKINNILEKIVAIFSTYVSIAYNINRNISVLSNLFDYDDVFEFDIEGGNESIENMEETFTGILNSITTYAFNKNIEYNVFEKTVNKREKIDRAWLDMEKKYV